MMEVNNMERSCVIVFIQATGRVTGQIREGDEIIKELSFFLGKLHQKEPSMVETMIRNRYSDWAKINGVTEIEIRYQ